MPRYAWAHFEDQRLLDMRLCDLKLDLKRSTRLQRLIDRLYSELKQRGLRFRPHCWLSSEWFSPDDAPGIAIPFYLAHDRLRQLERTQMLEVEGGTDIVCMKILRHEAGHCLDTAYRLHRRKRWRETFGSFATPYPDAYRPRPGSRRFVTHLDGWYAQAHPAEDFAETFAVWLKPKSNWRNHYAGWPAIEKLQYVDEVMCEIADQPAPVRTRKTVEPLSQLRKTLREHYHEKRLRFADEFPDFYDSDLQQIFSSAERYATRPTAAAFLRQHRKEIRDAVAKWTGTHAYTIEQVLRDMIDRSKELRLRLAVPQDIAKREAMMRVTVQTMNYLHAGHRPLAI